MNHTSPLIMAKLGSDDSPESPIIQHLRKLAVAMDAEILLFRSIYRSNYEKDISELSDRQRKHEGHDVVLAREELDHCAESLRKNGLAVTVSLNWRKPHDSAFTKITQRIQPELILCGRSPGTLLGRIAHSDPDWQLTTLTDIPILYVDKPPGKIPTHTVWAAVDPIHEDENHRMLNDRIVEKARDLAAATESEVHLVHCYSSAKKLAEIAVGLASAEYLPAQEVQLKTRNEHMSKLTDLAKRNGIEHKYIHNLPGVAQVVLPVLAARKRPDIVVAGANNSGKIASFLFGSTAQKLLHRMTGPLCVVRLPDSALNAGEAIAPSPHSASETM